MKLEKFEAENNHKAMQLVQKKLGMDAYIYSTKRVAGGVEILAGKDQFVGEDESELDNPFITNLSNKEWLTKLGDDINEIKIKLSEFNSQSNLNYSQQSKQHQLLQPDNQLIVEMLRKMYFSEQFIQEYLLKHIPNNSAALDANQIIETILDEIILIDKQEFRSDYHTKVLVGPTGVGKTLSIAKLADDYLRKGHQPSEIVYITTDFNDVTGLNQAQYYSKVLDIRMEYAHEPEELAYLIARLPQSIKLIDTFGISKRDNTTPNQLFSYFDGVQSRLEFMLTLPANAQEELLLKSLDEFKGYPITSCIITKEDESLSLATVIAACARYKAKISYIGNGQSIQGSLRQASKKQITKQLIRSVNDSLFTK